MPKKKSRANVEQLREEAVQLHGSDRSSSASGRRSARSSLASQLSDTQSATTESMNNLELNRLASTMSPLAEQSPFTANTNSFEPLEEVLDFLTDKKSSARESAWRILLQALSQKYSAELVDFMQPHAERVWDLCKRTLQRDVAADEGLSACRCLALLALAMDWTGAEETFKDIFPVLQRIIKNQMMQEALHVEAILVLGLLCRLMCSEERSLSFLFYFQEIFSQDQEPGAKVLVAALQSWSFLLAQDELLLQDGDQVSDVILSLVELLKHTDVDVRITAGEALALVAELCSQHQSYVEEFRECSDFIAEAMGGLVNLTTSLESAKRIQKKDRASQKSAFRDCLATIESFPQRVFTAGFELQFKGETIPVDSWQTLKRLQQLRLVLTDGLQTYVQQGHSVVREWLGLSGLAARHFSEDQEMSKEARKEEQDSWKKARGQWINKNRGEKYSRRDMWLD